MEREHPYSRLTPHRVLAALEAVGLEPDARIFPLNSYENRVYQVGLVDGSAVIVKFYRPGRWLDEQIWEEHAFASELAALEIPVVEPLRLGGADSLSGFEGFRFAVFPRCPGRPSGDEDDGSLPAMGRFLGRIHAVGETGRFRHRPRLTVRGHAAESRRHLLENDFIPPDLTVAYETLADDLIGRLEGRLDLPGALRIHGDCHPGNVLWRDGTPHFVDFDDTMTGPAIQDIWMMLSGGRDRRQAQLSELAEGYSEFRSFPAGELALVEPLRTLRLMHYSAWLARRWEDPAFPMAFPWFNTPRYWAEHILALREQQAALDEPPLELY